MNIEGTTAEVTQLRVAPAWHGHGFGTTVYQELERRARAEGYDRLVLDTGAENDVARGFHDDLGFDCRREVTIDFGPHTIDLALSERSIPAPG